ncbi:MAG TPA: ribonuclease III [Terriglobales bacterium]|nr:ribonuclease III [Terriglobales bacterium]
MKPDRVEKAAGYAFRDPELLRRALTHSSYAYEREPGDPRDNELLEFVGDSVVGLATAEFYYRAFPGRSEGELSKLKALATSTQALARLARKVRLDKAVLLGRGEERSGGRAKRSILAGAFEALVGAVYFDGGFDAARDLVQRLLSPTLAPIKGESFEINNPKSALQELFQKAGLPAPAYRTLAAKGPEHRRTFTVEVLAGDRPLAKAKGPSKKSAELSAARKAVKASLGRKMKELTPDAFIIEGED